MRMLFTFALLAGVAALGGCASPQQRAEAACVGAGMGPGSGYYRECFGESYRGMTYSGVSVGVGMEEMGIRMMQGGER